MPRARTGPAAEPTAYSHHSAERTNLPTPETSGSVASTPDLAETPLPDQSIEEQPSRTRYPGWSGTGPRWTKRKEPTAPSTSTRRSPRRPGSTHC